MGNDRYGKKSTRLGALHHTFEENGILPDTIELNDFMVREVKKYADAVPDYRYPTYTRHLLGDIIMIVFYAVLRNANEWGVIESFAKRKENGCRNIRNSLTETRPMPPAVL